MRLVVLGSKVFERNVSVLLGCGQTGMPEEFLDRAKVRSSFEQMSREGVSQRVCRQSSAGRKLCSSLLDKTLYITGVEPAAAEADEHRRMAILLGIGKAGAISSG